MNELANKYADMFEDNFPFFICSNMADAEIEEIIKTCLETGRPYAPQYKSEYDY